MRLINNTTEVMKSPKKLINDVKILVDGDGQETIVMIHGWPDTPSVWNDQVNHFKANYRCVRISLPCYEGPSSRQKFDIEEIVTLIKDVFEQYGTNQKNILMVHDWGAGFGYQFYNRHPELVSEIIGVDIGDMNSLLERASFNEKLMIWSYQFFNILTWYLGRFGDKLTRLTAKAFDAPAEPSTIFSSMNWPYYMFWLAGKGAYKNTFTEFNPSCPFLFVYGTDKPMMFHNEEWAIQQAAQANNKVLALDCDHWVMVRQPERFNDEVERWLDSLETMQKTFA